MTKLLKKFKEDVQQLRATHIKKIRDVEPRIGFTSTRKRMSTIIYSETFFSETNKTGYRMLLKGGSEIVLDSCDFKMNTNVYYS